VEILSQRDFATILRDRCGLHVIRNRATCPNCQGSSKLTMAVRDDFAYCHRCKHVIQRRRLQPLPVTPEEKAECANAQQFREWTSTLEQILSRELVRLGMIVEFAKRTLAIFSEDETAWGELAAFYHSEAALMGALDFVSCEKTSRWLEFPMSKGKLRQAFDDACASLNSGEKDR
jgi:hypothetical protein